MSLAADMYLDMSLPEESNTMFASPLLKEREMGIMDSLFEGAEFEREQDDEEDEAEFGGYALRHRHPQQEMEEQKQQVHATEAETALLNVAAAPSDEPETETAPTASTPSKSEPDAPPSDTAAPAVAPAPSGWNSPLVSMQAFVLMFGFIQMIMTARRAQILVGGLNMGDQCLEERGVDGGLTPYCAGLYTKVDFIDFTFALCAAGLSVIVLPAVGRLSDRQGRKRWIVCAPLATLLLPINLLCIAAPDQYVPNDVKHYFVYSYFACRSFAVTFDLMSLVTAELPLLMGPGDDRTRTFARVASLQLLTACIGPVISSFLPDVVCAMCAIVIAITCFLWALFRLPHVRAPKPENKVIEGAPRPSLCSEAGPLAPVLSFRILWSSRALLRMTFIVFLFRFLVYGMMEVSILSMRYRFGKDAATVYVGVINAFFSLVASVLVEALVPRLYMRRWNHRQIILLGLTSYASASMLPVFVPKTPWLLLPVLVLIAASIMVFPAVSLYMSSIVDPSQQGRVFGAIGSVRLLGQASGPFVLTAILRFATHSGESLSYHSAFTAAYWRSLAWSPFALALLLCLVAMLVARGVVVKGPTKEQIEQFLRMKAQAEAAKKGGGAAVAAAAPPKDESKEQLKVPLLEADSLSSPSSSSRPGGGNK